ncbi:MAG: hypothetical protein HOK72_08725 [Flavobacteriales bacterium]|jgi:hypothetical protein|nr:hypothetical protein [Flavobacteriales bacterium]
MLKIDYLLPFFFIAFSLVSFAQDDLMDMLEAEATEELGNEKVQATFKTQRIINLHSNETVKKKTLDFRVTHRFGSVGLYKAHDLFGMDNVNDIRISFDYGITDYLQIGIARSKRQELIDGSFKFRPFTQTTNNKVPVSLVLLGQIGFTPQRDPDSLYLKTAHRFNYTYQLIIARKFGTRISVEIAPTLTHRNIIRRYVNPDNGAEEQNTMFALGAGGRFKITQRTAVLIDYFYIFSKYRQNNSTTPFYNPLGIGIEIETGGHVFHLVATNAAGIVAGNYLPYNNESWRGLGIKAGFNISRVFNVGKR